MGAVPMVPMPVGPCCQSSQVCDGKMVSSGSPEDGFLQASALSNAMDEEPIEGKIAGMPTPVHYSSTGNSSSRSSNRDRDSGSAQKVSRCTLRKTAKGTLRQSSKELDILLKFRHFASDLPSPTENETGKDDSPRTSHRKSVSPKNRHSSRATRTSRDGPAPVAQPGSLDVAARVSATEKADGQLAIRASRESRRISRSSAAPLKFAEREMNMLDSMYSTPNSEHSVQTECQVNVGYRGQWDGSQRHGIGRQHWQDRCFYEGEWENNRPHGRGKFETLDNEKYVGQWLNGEQHGIGTFSSRRYSYFGQWSNGLQDGCGLEIFLHQNDGTFQEFRFAGSFVEGVKQGVGICRWGDGGEYYGTLEAGVISGEGNHTDTKGHIFRGQFVSSMKHGRGSHSWPDGRSFGGEYDYDQADGYGFYTWPDGRKDIGFWIDKRFFNKVKYSMSDISNRIARTRIHRNSAQKNEGDTELQDDDSCSDASLDGDENDASFFHTPTSFHLEAHIRGRSKDQIARLPDRNQETGDRNSSQSCRRMTDTHIFLKDVVRQRKEDKQASQDAPPKKLSESSRRTSNGTSSSDGTDEDSMTRFGSMFSLAAFNTPPSNAANKIDEDDGFYTEAS